MDAVFPQVRHVSDPTQERVEHNRVPVRLRLTLRLRGGIVQVVFAGSPLLKGIDLSSNGDDQRGCGSGCEKIQGAPKGGDPAGTGDMKHNARGKGQTDKAAPSRSSSLGVGGSGVV